MLICSTAGAETSLPCPLPAQGEGWSEGVALQEPLFAAGFSPLPEPVCAQRVQCPGGGGAEPGVTLCQLWAVLSVQFGCWMLNRRGQQVCGQRLVPGRWADADFSSHSPRALQGNSLQILYPNLAPTHLTRSQNSPVLKVCESQQQLFSLSLSSCPPGLFIADQTSCYQTVHF